MSGRWWRLGVAALAGAACGLAFPPVSVGAYAAVAVALLTLACLGAGVRLAAGCGAIAGAAFFLPLLHWMTVVGTDAWLLLSALCIAWWALLGALTAVLGRVRGWPVWIASAWVLVEWLRGAVPLGGFPWGRLAFGQADSPWGQLAPWLGLTGTSFVVALTGTSAIALAVAIGRQGPWRTWVPWAATTAVAFLVPAALPVGTLPATGSATVAIVQGGTPQTGMGAFDVRAAVLANHVRETLGLAARVASGQVAQPDFVLWPESASDIDPLRDAAAAAAIGSAARAIGAPIVVGTRIRADDGIRDLNVALAWDPVDGPGEGPGQRYAKRQLVPFGEYVPFREELAPLIGRLDRVAVDLAPGETPGHLDVAGIPIGVLICFEVAYDGAVAGLMDDPASTGMIAVQTNNATYALTGQPEQQLQITRMRALETGRTVAVAATTGISAVIAPDGTLRDSLGELATGTIVAEVPTVSASPPSRVTGPVLGILAGLAALGALGAGLRRGRVPGQRAAAGRGMPKVEA